MNWWGIKNTSTGAIVSYTSDNSKPLPGGLQYMGPYASQEAAQAALEPLVPSADEILRQTLIAQSAATATAAQQFQALQLWLKRQKF